MSLHRSQRKDSGREELLAEFAALERQLAEAKKRSARISEILDTHPQLFGTLPSEHVDRVRIALADIERIWGEIVDALAALGLS